MASAYAKWVRNNEPHARNLERLTQTLTLFGADATNLLRLEAFWTLSRLHTMLNDSILQVKNSKLSLNSGWKRNFCQRLTDQLQRLVELFLRTYYGHRVAWNTLLVFQILRALIILLDSHRLILRNWRRPFLAFQNVLYSIRRFMNYSDNQSTLATHQSSQKSSQLTVPSVEVGSYWWVGDSKYDSFSSTGGSQLCWWRKYASYPLRCLATDLCAGILDGYYFLRPLLLVWSARHVAPPNMPNMSRIITAPISKEHWEKIVESCSKPLKSLEDVVFAPLHHSLLARWDIWGSFFVVDSLAAFLSWIIKNYRFPVLQMPKDIQESVLFSDSHSAFSMYETREISKQGLPPCSHEISTDLSDESKQDIERWKHARRTFFFSFLRDPFFAIVLRELCYKYLVNGRFQRLVPILGPLFASQVGYYLAMQHSSFAYTLGS